MVPPAEPLRQLEATLEAAERTATKKLGRVVYVEAVRRDIEHLRTWAVAAFEVDPHPVARVRAVSSKLSETGLAVSSSRNPRFPLRSYILGRGLSPSEKEDPEHYPNDHQNHQKGHQEESEHSQHGEETSTKGPAALET